MIGKWMRTGTAISSCCLWLFVGAPAAAQAPAYLVKDINATVAPSDSVPGPAIVLAGVTLFGAWSGSLRDLWRTDGTPEGTTLVKAGIASGSELGDFVPLGSIALFVGYDASHGGELWRTDGTVDGTALIKDINPGPGSAFPTEFVVPADHSTIVRDQLFFLADDGTHGLELWKTDGTADGTVLVKDINPGLPSGLELDRVGRDFPDLTAVGAMVFFVADDGVHGPELWRSDGTELGTSLVRDIRSDYDSFVSDLIAVEGNLFFTAAEAGAEHLWYSDGTEGGTRPVTATGNTFPYPEVLTPLGVSLLFCGRADPGETGWQIWRTDGTEGGTEQLTDYDTLSSCPERLAVMQDFVFFFIQQLVPHGDGFVWQRQLWRTDGTIAGTSLVRSFAGETANLSVAGNRLFFAADDGETGMELWLSDGTSEGTVRVRDINPGPSGSDTASFFVADGEIFFIADDGSSGFELWHSDGTEGGTRRLGDLNPGRAESYPSFLTYTDGVLLFRALRNDIGIELWKSDGTETGTGLLANLAADTDTMSSYPQFRADLDGTLLFWADGGEDSIGLWKSDGTEGGTVFLGRLPYVNSVALAASQAFFTSNDSQTGPEVWVTDGTAAGTRLVRDILPGPGGSVPYDAFFLPLGDEVYFAAADGAAGTELWKSDGTEEGTRLIFDVNPGPASGLAERSSNIAALGPIVLFAADDGQNGVELWRSDGTEGGTQRVLDINPGAAGSNPTPYSSAVLGGAIFFSADDGESGVELWRSDGTAAGTQRIRDIQPGSASSIIGFLAVVGDRLFFYASDGTSAFELWATDGTAAGTNRVRDTRTREPLSEIGSSLAVGDTLLFSAATADLGTELWKIDATAADATLVSDINAGTNGSGPFNFVRAGELLYFLAYEPSTGEQIWKSDGTAAGTQRVSNFGRVGIRGYSTTALFFADGDRVLFGYYCLDCFPFVPFGSTAALEPMNDGGSGNGAFTVVVQLWETDGTESGTRRVSDAHLYGRNGVQNTEVFRSGRFAYFASPGLPTAGGANRGVELWALPLDSLGNCGNGTVDPGEACDTRAGSSECDVDCTPPDCGDRVVNTAAGEQCDDGTSDEEDCCTSACTATAAGAPCSDNSLCTKTDSCDGSGECVSGAPVDCVGPGGVNLCSASRGCGIVPCAGDCDHDGEATVDELLRGIGVALGELDIETCSGLDGDENDRVSVDEVVRALHSVLDGCPVPG